MRYRASCFNTKGLAILLGVLSALFIGTGVALRSFPLLAFGLAPILYVWLISRRLWASLGDSRVEIQGWLNHLDCSIQDLKSVTHTESLLWPRDRYYGPATYELRTDSQHVTINLLYFPPEFNRQFHHLIVNGK